jgi:chaperone LolA
MKSAVLRAAAVLLFMLPSAWGASIDATLKSMSSIETSFTHRFLAKGFRNEQVERGKVVFGSAPRMRWSYSAPEKKEFLFDGTTSWLYTPSEKQVIVSELSPEERRELPFLLLNDPVATNASFHVRESKTKGLVATVLTAKRPSDAIRQITIPAGEKDRMIRKLEYSDRSGNRTTFEFTNHRRASTPDQSFRFSVPSGVEVVRQ